MARVADAAPRDDRGVRAATCRHERLAAPERAAREPVDHALLYGISASQAEKRGKELFDQLEQTLPDDVRITAVDPGLGEKGEFVILISVQARRSEDVDAFIESLEKTGSFRDVITPAEQIDNDGLLGATIKATYVRPEGPRG